jgi:parallel beta-helix repeat protein
LAQGLNFGIGLPNSADTGNVVEGNTIVGNANGIVIAPGTHGNIFHGNLITGNPPIQLSLDNPASGLDIADGADPGANAFEGNICLTSNNAPCPSVGPSFTASPNPIPITGTAFLGATTLSWNAPDVQVIEIHIGSPDGKLVTYMGNRGSFQTGAWIPDGMKFYLQDVTDGKPLTADYTLATVTVNLQKSASNTGAFHVPGGGPLWAGSMAALLVGLGLLVFASKRLKSVFGGTALIATMICSFPLSKVAAQTHPSVQETAATLDRMIAAHKSQQELAQYIFDTHGCKGCHTVDQNGKPGFTDRGRQVAGDFEGCIRLLTDVSRIAQEPESQRSIPQRQKAARFEEFGCTFCHKLNSGKMGLTEVGAKLTHLHLGCVDVGKLVASSPAHRH